MEMSKLLKRIISFHDYQENFYHAFTLGLWANAPALQIKSNTEAGLGRPDIMIMDPKSLQALVIECKLSPDSAQLPVRAAAALTQIKERHYTDPLVQMGYTTCKVGLSFYKKQCVAACEI